MVHWFGEDSYELYNLSSDISELRDISKEEPELLERLSTKLNTWQQNIPGK
ncbi:hypothetical protein ACFL2H_04860 [Planctomycetota bacterium]